MTLQPRPTAAHAAFTLLEVVLTLSLAVVLPDASGIPLVDIQYRSNLSLEFNL